MEFTRFHSPAIDTNKGWLSFDDANVMTKEIIAEANRRRDAEWREKLEELKGDLFNANGVRQARWKLYHFTGVEMPPNKIFDAVLDEAKKLFL